MQFEYGAMSSKFSIQAEDKLAAYAAMCFHYRFSPHLIAIYAPEESRDDMWMDITGQMAARLDEVFGGPGAFDKYVEENTPAIAAAYKTITQMV